MAKIRDLEAQRRALKDINTTIKELDSANEFLKAQNSSGIYTITFTGDDGKKYTREIKMETKDDLNARVMIYKEEEKKRIIALADEHGIDLDPEDIEILDFTI